jgi:hypothetical protein
MTSMTPVTSTMTTGSFVVLGLRPTVLTGVLVDVTLCVRTSRHVLNTHQLHLGIFLCTPHGVLYIT